MKSMDLAHKLKTLRQEEYRLRSEREELRSTISTKMKDWDHLMREHQGSYNLHGIFVKDKCEIDLWMGTNCGCYWIASVTNCQNFEINKQSKICDSCQMVKEVANEVSHDNDDDPSDYLEQLASHQYTFYGWKSKKLADETCHCHQ
jgi:hypothetical protein